jgi:cbb3-type cytochrome c oxidase subunit III
MNRLVRTAVIAGCVVVAAAVYVRAVAPAQSPVDGKTVFLTHCAACHQASGSGAGPFPPLAGNGDVTATDSSNVIATVLNGKTGPITIEGKQFAGAMPSWRGKLSDAEIAAVLTYVRSAWGNSAPAVSEDQVALVASPEMMSGQEIFTTHCATCHQAGGGGTAAYPPLAHNPAVMASDPAAIVAIIVNGRSGPLGVNGTTYNGTMPTWKGQLSNADIAAVATYIRSSWGNGASGVTEQQVAAAGAAVSTAVGQSIFSQRCSSCHGADGKGGGGGVFPALAGNADVIAPDPGKIISTIENGRNIMPSWRGQLSAADIAAVVTYLRSAWGNNASPVTEAQVSAVK